MGVESQLFNAGVWQNKSCIVAVRDSKYAQIFIMSNKVTERTQWDRRAEEEWERASREKMRLRNTVPRSNHGNTNG